MKIIKLVIAIISLSTIALLAGCSSGGGTGSGKTGNSKVGLKVVFGSLSSASSSSSSSIQNLGIDSLILDIIPANPAITPPGSINLTSTSALSITLPDPVSPATSEPYLFRITAWKDTAATATTAATSKIIYSGQTRTSIAAGNNTIDLKAIAFDGFDAVAGAYTVSASDGTTIPLTIDKYGKGTGMSSGGNHVTAYLAPVSTGIFDVTIVSINTTTNTVGAYGSGTLNGSAGTGSGSVTDDAGLHPTWTATRNAAAAASLPTIPTVTGMAVDGSTADWSGIQAVVTDPAGDGSALAGSDIKAVYLAKDSSNMYVRIDLANGPPSSTLFYGVAFAPASSSQVGDRFVFINMFSPGVTVDQWTDLSTHSHSSIIGGTIAVSGNTIEVSVPLAALAPPAMAYVHAWDDISGPEIDSTATVLVQVPAPVSKTLYKNSFESLSQANPTNVAPLVPNQSYAQSAMVWSGDASTGVNSVNFIPNGNPITIGGIILSGAALGVPIDVTNKSSINLSMFINSTSNPRPSIIHNCDSSLNVYYSLDSSPFVHKTAICGTYVTENNGWWKLDLPFNVAGASNINFKFEYTIQNSAANAPSAYFKIDDLIITDISP